MSSQTALDLTVMEQTWSHNMCTLCDVGQKHVGHCFHIQQVSVAMEANFRSPQHKALMFCKLLLNGSTSCQACASKFRSIMTQVTQSIESNVEA